MHNVTTNHYPNIVGKPCSISAKSIRTPRHLPLYYPLEQFNLFQKPTHPSPNKKKDRKTTNKILKKLRLESLIQCILAAKDPQVIRGKSPKDWLLELRSSRVTRDSVRLFAGACSATENPKSTQQKNKWDENYRFWMVLVVFGCFFGATHYVMLIP